MDERKEFLTKVYDQMFNDIDRHHKIVWETMGLLIGAFAVLALAEKEIISIDIATALIVLLAAWVLTHVYDSNYWYNRNLVIIANIERQFLTKEDLRNIHYYFGRHRDKNAIQTSLKIQIYFCFIVIGLFLFYHFSKSVFPGLQSELDWDNLRIEKLAPYLCVVAGLFIVRWIKRKREKDYEEFLHNSPGIEIDATDIVYGQGHPTKR
jgi:hypothetical protein